MNAASQDLFCTLSITMRITGEKQAGVGPPSMPHDFVHNGGHRRANFYRAPQLPLVTAKGNRSSATSRWKTHVKAFVVGRQDLSRETHSIRQNAMLSRSRRIANRDA